MFQFQALNKENQAETVWKGFFVMKRDEENYTVVLYKVDSFFVEVYYDVTNQIYALNSFASIESIAPYFALQQLN